jgi:hypothetical protein
VFSLAVFPYEIGQAIFRARAGSEIGIQEKIKSFFAKLLILLCLDRFDLRVSP